LLLALALTEGPNQKFHKKIEGAPLRALLLMLQPNIGVLFLHTIMLQEFSDNFSGCVIL